MLTDLDKKNAEDILIIAVETIYEIKLYDWTALNPINMILITMLEHAVHYYPTSVRVRSWQIKMYSKLGLATKITNISKMLYLAPDEKNFERLGAARLSVYTDYGMSDQLGALITEFEEHYRDGVNANKNLIVTAFAERDFEAVNPLMEKNDKLQRSGF